MARTLKSDKTLFLATLLLAGASVFMVYTASAVPALGGPRAPYFFLLKQLAWVTLGVSLMLGVMRIDYHEYRRPRLIWTLLAVTVVGLLLVFFFPPVNYTRRWISFTGLSLQPSELAKLVAILFTAAVLERRMHRINDVGYALLPIAVVAIGLAALIVKEPDFGTATVLVLVVMAVVFAAGLSYRYLGTTATILVIAAVLLILFAPYRLGRLQVFLDPSIDPMGKGFQHIQSLVAIGSGGPLGKGIMAGVYLPEAQSDFIYAVVGEELGLVGTTVILASFLLITWRGLRTALVAPDRFGTLLALGLTLMVAFQALVNMSVVIGLLPTKGIPLPFVSNGGSSLVINLVAMGILLNISQQSSPVVAATVKTPVGELVVNV